jgi:hypothetical protein
MNNSPETLVKVVLTRIYSSDEKKDGTKYIDKNGKPYKRVAIQTNSHGETWLSCFSFRDTDEMRNWQEGQEVQMLISQNGDYWNFREPRKLDLLEERVIKLEKEVFKTNISAPTVQEKKEIGSIDEMTTSNAPF